MYFCDEDILYWFKLSWSALILFGLKKRGLLILLLPDVSPASVAGIFREPGSWVIARTRSQVVSVDHGF